MGLVNGDLWPDTEWSEVVVGVAVAVGGGGGGCWGKRIFLSILKTVSSKEIFSLSPSLSLAHTHIHTYTHSRTLSISSEHTHSLSQSIYQKTNSLTQQI